jgi:DNA-binding NarL/FixJ family response regulator
LSEQEPQSKIGIFLVAESPITRQGAASILSQQNDMEIIGQAGSTDEAFSLTGSITTQTVLLRIISPGGSYDVVHRLRHISPATCVVVVAEYEDDEGLYQAVIAGASAYLTKGYSDEQLFSTIRRVSNGEQLISRRVLNRPRVALRILDKFKELPATTKGVEPLISPLSSYEEEVLHLLANGNSAEAVAHHLNASQDVIITCMNSILQKIDVNQRTQNKVISLISGQP